MTNTFNPARFSRLLRKQWVENRKIFITSTAILFGTVALSYAFALMTSNYIQFGQQTLTLDNAHQFFRFSTLNFRMSLLGFSGLFYLALLSGHYFLSVGRPATAIQELTLPVSRIERTVGALLLSAVLTLVVFSLTFLLVDTLFVTGLKAIYHDTIQQADEFHRITELEYGFPYLMQITDRKSLPFLLMLGFMLSSVFTLGSVYFSRLPFIKTAFAMVVFLGVLVAASTFIDGILRSDRVYVGHDDTTLYRILPFLIIILTVAMIWLATYFRLKEKEV